MKTVGIIGGLGPETTSKFYLEVVFGCYGKNKESRPLVLIWSVPLKYEIEDDLIKKAEGEERYISYLTEAAKGLERDGADFLVMPCNSLHVFIEDIREAVRIPVLSIVEETTKFLKKKKMKKVGLLATSSSLKSGFYKKAFDKEGIEQVAPDGPDQSKINSIIRNLVLGMASENDGPEFSRILERLEKKGAEEILMACTDLQLLARGCRPNVHDTMKILADATVDAVLGKTRL